MVSALTNAPSDFHYGIHCCMYYLWHKYDYVSALPTSTYYNLHVCGKYCLQTCNVAAAYVRWQYSNYNGSIDRIENRVWLRLTDDSFLGPYIEIGVCKGRAGEA